MKTEFKIQWDEIPCYYIMGNELVTPYDICNIMKKNGTRKYVYRVTLVGKNGLPNLIIKYGMSADNSRNYGERIYRQIAHSRSWGDQRLRGSSGADWIIIEDDVLEKFDITIDYKDIIITIFDLTNYPFVLQDEWLEVNKIESHYIKEYTRIFGSKPIGNLNDEHNAHFRPFIKKSTFFSLFEV
jgi:hypothetical protein